MSLLDQLAPSIAPQLLATVAPILNAADAQAAQLQATNGALTGQLGQATADAIAALAKATAGRIAPGTDLAPLFPTAAKQFGSPGAAYAWNNTANSKIQSGGFAGQNNSIALKPVAGGSTGIRIDGDGVEISGAALAGPVVGMLITGIDPAKRIVQPRGFDLHHLGFDGSLGTGINLEQWADNARITYGSFGVIGGDSIYCTADDMFAAICAFAGSQGEHNVRFDINAETKHRPARATMALCDFRNATNPQKKENLAIRELDGGTFIVCTFDSWVGVGQQDHSANPTWHARNIVFIGCVWTGKRSGGALLQIENDADVTLIGCDLPAFIDVPAITVGDRSKLILQNCRQIIPAGVDPKTVKPLAKGSGTIAGLETVTQVAA